MRDIPVMFDGYRLTVVEPPAQDQGRRHRPQIPVTDRNGVIQFVVSLFAKLRVGPVSGRRRGRRSG